MRAPNDAEADRCHGAQIEQLKEVISKEKGWEVGAQKLIYSGKILDNTKTVGFYNIEEKGFIVCMVAKVSGALGSLQSEY